MRKGRLRVKTPAALVEPARLACGDRPQPVRFGHLGDQWADRVDGAVRGALRHQLRPRQRAAGIWTRLGKWRPQPAPELNELRAGRLLGVDLNDGHLGGCVLDSSGNPVGEPVSIAVVTAGLSRVAPRWAGARSDRRPARSRPPRTTARRWWSRTSTSPTRGPPDGKHSAAVNGANGCAAPSPASPPADSATGSQAWPLGRGIAVIGVDPAYTSRWGAQHWRIPCSSRLPIHRPSPPPSRRGRPRSADVASDWRSGDGRQDPATDSGPLRAHHRPGPTHHRSHGGRHGSSGSPTRPP